MTLAFFMVELLNGLSIGMLLFLLAGGLSLIFGMMNVMNLAHGSLYLIAAFLGWWMVVNTKNFWLAMLVAPCGAALLALLLERLLRSLYSRGHLDQVLATFGLSIAATEAVRLVWGVEIRSIPVPPLLSANLQFMGSPFPTYRLFIIAVGLMVFVCLLLLVERSRLGAIVRAVVDDHQMVDGLGVNVSAVFIAVFALSGLLAGLSGVVAAPILGVYSGLDFEVLLLALAVVVVGGVGTVRGAFVASLLVAEAETLGKLLLPPGLELFVLFLMMTGVLLLKPNGLFGKKAMVS